MLALRTTWWRIREQTDEAPVADFLEHIVSYIYWLWWSIYSRKAASSNLSTKWYPVPTFRFSDYYIIHPDVRGTCKGTIEWAWLIVTVCLIRSYPGCSWQVSMSTLPKDHGIEVLQLLVHQGLLPASLLTRNRVTLPLNICSSSCVFYMYTSFISLYIE